MMKMSEEWNYGRNGSLLATEEVTIKLLLAALSTLKDGALARSRNGLFTHMTETEAHLARSSLLAVPGLKVTPLPLLLLHLHLACNSKQNIFSLPPFTNSNMPRMGTPLIEPDKI